MVGYNASRERIFWALTFLPRELEPFVKSGWKGTCKKGAKLYENAYFTSLTRWMERLPAAVKRYVPEDLIVKHVLRDTECFIKVRISFFKH